MVPMSRFLKKNKPWLKKYNKAEGRRFHRKSTQGIKRVTKADLVSSLTKTEDIR